MRNRMDVSSTNSDPNVPNNDSDTLHNLESRPKSSFDYESNLFRHQMRLRAIRITPPPPLKTTIAAVIFLIGGFAFLIAGLVVYFGPDSGRGLPMIILGSIMFLPGSYSSYILYGTWKGWDGFDYSQVPSYDDE